jgi:hypothetical protein
MNHDPFLFKLAMDAADVKLSPWGFTHLGNGVFSRDGVLYDLSAADLEQIDRIVREGLFVIPN